ncbi:hypothetical protein F5Y08DRAFT_314712 [Xylaria arbuscula]|nr:hypothetical protein F5Y08DRAFT_314712 [Xylaria arbuscula]
MASVSSARRLENGAQSDRRSRDQENLTISSATNQSRLGRYSYASLRSATSRFSLNEQFATTRRDYEFGDDDASSTWERLTVQSHHTKDGLDAASVIVVNSEDLANSNATTWPFLDFEDLYDILCVPCDPPTESLLRAYLRISPLFDPEPHPPHLRPVAEAYSKMITGTFEILLDPYQQAHYNLISGTVIEGQSYPGAQSLAAFCGERSTNEVRASFDFREAVNPKPYPSALNIAPLELFDFEIGHTTSIDLSEPKHRLFQLKRQLEHFTVSGDTLTDKECLLSSTTKQLNGTTLTLQTSFYGLLRDGLAMGYQFEGKPIFPPLISQDRLLPLQVGRIRPQMAVNLRHVIPKRPSCRKTTGTLQPSASENCAKEETVVEIGTTILPDPIGSLSVSRSIVVPFDHTRSFVRLESEQILRERMLPRLAATIERPVRGGQMLVKIASGDYGRKYADEPWCIPAGFGGIKRTYIEHALELDGMPRMFLSPLLPPRVEIAFKNGCTFKSQDAYITRERFIQGIDALDIASDTGKGGRWTVTAAAEPRYYSIVAKHARDVNLSALDLHRPLSLLPKLQTSLDTDATIFARPPLRVEAEIGADSFGAGYLALRCLKRVGRFSKVGFEIGFSTYSLYLSMYWSRLDRRVNIPFYICPGKSLHLKTILLATVIPFAGLTLWELWDRHRGWKRHQQRLAAQRDHQYIQKRRAEADTLTTLMAPAVQKRQKAESAANGLVILSAKYGVKAPGAGEATAWGAAEVADVTFAVAALVDRGHLLIPSGVRKSHILGFWDPEPTEEKVLHVRYSFQGRETTVEVRGDDEQLELPPPWL